jgi:hypothetical protein
LSAPSKQDYAAISTQDEERRGSKSFLGRIAANSETATSKKAQHFAVAMNGSLRKLLALEWSDACPTELTQA